jgi:hypothetical protein
LRTARAITLDVVTQTAQPEAEEWVWTRRSGDSAVFPFKDLLPREGQPEHRSMETSDGQALIL